MAISTHCNHEWHEESTKLVCSKCGKTRLNLKRTEQEGLQIGTTSAGRKYSVRDDRSRFFFPNEWNKFYESLRDDAKPLFDVLINTGARIDEALNIMPEDFHDGLKKTLTLRVTKIKAKTGERVGKKRTFVISSQFYRRMMKYINDNKVDNGKVLFTKKTNTYWSMLRRKLEKLGFKDYYDFSLHNIRKTHGMWLVALNVPDREVCFRLGHTMDTFMKHYGSPNVFDATHKVAMLKVLGDVYNLQQSV